MNIKKTVKFSFFAIAVFVILIGSISSIVLHQVTDINKSKKYIAQLIILQEDMNSLIKDLMITKDDHSLNEIQKEFNSHEQEFEKIKDVFMLTRNDSFLDMFIIYLHKDKEILLHLNQLFKNETQIETAFNKLYVLQKEKIKFIYLFNGGYSIEKDARKNIENNITGKNIKVSEAFGYLQYFSKETLYQYRNEKSLNSWLEQIKKIKKHYNHPTIHEYENIVKNIGSYVISINSIEQQELVLEKYILNIIEENKDVNLHIELNIDKLASTFTTYIYIILFILLTITILFIYFLGRKVYRNIGLSVDEVENKIQEGLEQINLLNKEITHTQKEVVFTMGAIGESRSKETGNHVKRVAEYSKLLALEYGLPKEQAEMLKQASPMHDIGKVAIPDAILNKPGRFTDDERKIMDTHATLGYEMLNNSNRPLLKLAATVAYQHHEKWDGSGYPQGLKGEEIDITGRITALADVFDALGSDRVYKKAWEDERIFNLFKEEKGKHFDPQLIDIFFNNLEKFLEIRDRFKDIES